MASENERVDALAAIIVRALNGWVASDPNFIRHMYPDQSGVGNELTLIRQSLLEAGFSLNYDQHDDGQYFFWMEGRQ